MLSAFVGYELCGIEALKFCLKGQEMPAKVDVEKCTGCESCVDACPSEAIAITEEKAVIDAENCVECEVCVEECPAEAISME